MRLKLEVLLSSVILIVSYVNTMHTTAQVYPNFSNEGSKRCWDTFGKVLAPSGEVARQFLKAFFRLFG